MKFIRPFRAWLRIHAQPNAFGRPAVSPRGQLVLISRSAGDFTTRPLHTQITGTLRPTHLLPYLSLIPPTGGAGGIHERGRMIFAWPRNF